MNVYHKTEMVLQKIGIEVNIFTFLNAMNLKIWQPFKTR